MLFTNLTYMIFLIAVLLLYWNMPHKHRILLLLIASFIFYMSWSPPFGLIYGPLIFLDSLYFYLLSKAMVKWPTRKKMLLVVGVSSELSVLAFFKYANFIAGNVEAILTTFGWHGTHWQFDIFLPLAISFTNFILISYLVDVYRGNETPDPSFTRFAAYVSFFPHLIAGPIVRASELLRQFDQQVIFGSRFNLETFVKGLHRFIYGFAIKVLVADLVATYVNGIFGDPSTHNFVTSWVATYGFAIQILCDFSGYTLMAQGSALMLGYTLPENFDAPYFSKNISEFWHRWHMSLSRWLRDYLYIPLGGNRKGKIRTYINLFITMGLGGLWHGASWNFAIWGLYQGLLLSLHKLSDFLKINRLIPKFLAILITFHAVCIGWIFFRARTFETAWSMLHAMFNPFNMGKLSYEGLMTLAIITAFFTLHILIRQLSKREWHPALIATTQGVAYFAIIFLVITMSTNSQEFIYFQF